MYLREANEMLCRTLGHMWSPMEWLAHGYQPQDTGGQSYRKIKSKCEGLYCHRCQHVQTLMVGKRKYTRRVIL